jgi:hypothetical protein
MAMKAKNSRVERITKDVSTVVTLESGKEFTICGEIIDKVLDFQSVDVAFYQAKEFRELTDEDTYRIKVAAFYELQRFC